MTQPKKIIIKKKKNENISLNYDNEYSSYTGDEKEARIKIAKEFFTLLPESLNNKAIILEKSIFDEVFNYSKQKSVYPNWDNKTFRRFYINKVVSIANNLNTSSFIKNTYLIDKLVSGEIPIEKLASLNHKEIFPENWQKLIEKKKETDNILYLKKPEATTDSYKCSRCKSTKAKYFELQTRSCDEPTTIFLTCLNCNKRWKES